MAEPKGDTWELKGDMCRAEWWHR